MTPQVTSPLTKLGTARHDAVAQLLLLTARLKLDSRQLAVAKEIAESIDDWDAFSDIAARKFSLPIALPHIESIRPRALKSSQLEKMRSISKWYSFQAFRVAATQIAFHKACIAPKDVPHVYVKGPALAQQYYGSLTIRVCRDVDILVPDSHFAGVVRSALDKGYRLYLDLNEPRFAATAQEVRFVQRYCEVATLVGSDSVTIEVHRRLDKMSVNFKTARILRDREAIAMGGDRQGAMATTDHFTYICYHHARHFWSHLHWIADIDAVMTHDSFNRDAVVQRAEELGIKPTVIAAMELRDLSALPFSWQTSMSNGGGGQFLDACLRNLDGGLETELDLSQNMLLNDYMSAWQVTPGRMAEKWLHSWSRRVPPNLSQFLDHRYPEPLYWLYSGENALALLQNGVKRLLRRQSGSTNV
jgi:hypothetical protein